MYKLIDFGGCPRIKLGHGWKRRTWSKNWTTEREGDIVTPKHDLLELGWALVAIKWSRVNGRDKYPTPDNRIPTGRLSKYIDYCQSINEKKTDDYTVHYEELIKILKGIEDNVPVVSNPAISVSSRKAKEKENEKKGAALLRAPHRHNNNNNNHNNNSTARSITIIQ